MRDNLQTKDYFDSYISAAEDRIERFSSKLLAGEIKPERILPVKYAIFQEELDIVIAQYSRGDDIKQIKKLFDKIYDDWITSYYNPDAYNEMLRMISLAILLDINKELMQETEKKLSDSDNKDWLLDCLVSQRPGEYGLLWPKRFHTLKEISDTSDASERILLLKRYLKKEWYNSGCDLYQAHKSPNNIYYGYWSFEAGAIAKIFNIDDDNLQGEKYYPHDIVHFDSN